MVLDVVVGASGQQLGNLRPLVADPSVRVQDNSVFLCRLSRGSRECEDN